MRKSPLRLVPYQGDQTVCPSWCFKHRPSDQRLGNPDNTSTHLSDTYMVLDAMGDQVYAVLCQLTESGGTESYPPMLYIGGGHPLGLPAARALAQRMLELVAVAESK
ncbi:MAG: hypothetical protein QOI06_2328 [Nocardioidaceae bacterium]|nr:hypothetical protein [Nocardioidaceae bacterium]